LGPNRLSTKIRPILGGNGSFFIGLFVGKIQQNVTAIKILVVLAA
jgi:hypothetical protein